MRFGATVALDAIDLTVNVGEVVSVLGPSGSGKSTLLRAVAGLQRLDDGRILLDGQDQIAVPTHRRGVGLMFQDHALFPHRDVAGNVGFGLKMRGDRRADIADRVADLLDLVGLAGTEERSVSTLSGGEQQRVALARALAPSPRVLLLDEPFGALDRTLRERLVTELGDLFHNLGQTVVAVTHDQAEAFALGDRVVVMDRGRILQHGAPLEVWSRPASATVARFLGYPNLTAAEVGGGVAVTAWGKGRVELPDGHHQVLVRPADVRLGADGMRAVVRSTAFRGERVEVRLEADDVPTLVAWVDADGAPSPGDIVGVTLAPGAIVGLSHE